MEFCRHKLTNGSWYWVCRYGRVCTHLITLQEIKSATEVEAELQALAPFITHSWPERMTEVRSQLLVHFPFREELSVQDGVVFKGERIVVPSSLRQCMTNKAHAGHSRQPQESQKSLLLHLQANHRIHLKVQHFLWLQTKAAERIVEISQNTSLTMAEHLSRPTWVQRYPQLGYPVLAYNWPLFSFLWVGYTDVHDSQSGY